MIVHRHPRQFWHQPEMSADQPLDQARVSQPIEAAIAAIAGGGGKYQSEVARFSGLDKTMLQRLDDLVRRPDPDETGRGDGVAGPDDGDRLRGIDDLVAHQAAALFPNASV